MNYVHAHIITDDTTNFTTVQEFLETLTHAFGDPDKKGTAQRELRNLRQRNTDFASFMANFQRWALATGFDENSQISFLTDGISDELKQAMLSQITPTTLKEYITLLQRMDNKLRALAAEKARLPVVRTYNSGTVRYQAQTYVAPTSTTTRKITMTPASSTMSAPTVFPFD